MLSQFSSLFDLTRSLFADKFVFRCDSRSVAPTPVSPNFRFSWIIISIKMQQDLSRLLSVCLEWKEVYLAIVFTSALRDFSSSIDSMYGPSRGLACPGFVIVDNFVSFEASFGLPTRVLWSPHPSGLLPSPPQRRLLAGSAFPGLDSSTIQESKDRGSGQSFSGPPAISSSDYPYLATNNFFLLQICLWKDSHSCTVHDISSNIIRVSFDGWTSHDHNMRIWCHLSYINCILEHLHGTGSGSRANAVTSK